MKELMKDIEVREFVLLSSRVGLMDKWISEVIDALEEQKSILNAMRAYLKIIHEDIKKINDDATFYDEEKE